MPRRAAAKVEPRPIEQVRVDLVATEATCDKIRRLLDTTMSAIRSVRFTPYVVEENGKGVPVRKRNPLLKDLREYSATLKAARAHLVDLRAEEAALQKACADDSSPWSDFKVKPVKAGS